MNHGMKILRNRDTGEQVCVIPDAERYPDAEWETVEEGVTHPRGANKREGGKWVYDRAEHDNRVVQITAREWEALHNQLAAMKTELATLSEKLYSLPEIKGG